MFIYLFLIFQQFAVFFRRVQCIKKVNIRFLVHKMLYKSVRFLLEISAHKHPHK
jgi:hypothetical protein